VFAGPVYKLHRGDSNDERAAVDLMRRFDRWRELYGFGLLTEVHLRKPPPQGARLTIHDFFGSSAYTRGAEVVLGLQRVRAPAMGACTSSRIARATCRSARAGACCSIPSRAFRRDPKDVQPSTRDLVAELRESDPDITQAQAAAALDLTERTVRKYWHADADEGQESLLDDE
jgi:hypothetical protein